MRDAPGPRFSIVVPVCDEEGAAAGLAREIAAAFAGETYEMLFVDDGSADRTAEVLSAAGTDLPQLRLLRHARNAGQSRALRTGVMAARAQIIVTLDGDGQNDPADAPAIARELEAAEPRCGMIGGERVRRRDPASKRWASSAANALRSRLLSDGARDTGCGLKAIRREAFLRLPFFDHMHRYLPALMLREGYAIAFRPVSHRPRTSGHSKYGNFSRLVAAASDLLGVIWLRRRARDPGEIKED